MLYKPKYLDEDTLSTYIAALEGGLKHEETTRSGGSSGLSGNIKAPWVGANANKETSSESTANFSDHSAARLKRLIESGRADPEKTGWVQILEPDTSFNEIGTGALIEWECEIYIPDLISAMHSAQQNINVLGAMSALVPSAKTLGLDTKGMPDEKIIQTMTDFFKEIDDLALVVVGEDSDTDWKVIGTAHRKWIVPNAEFDGPSKIIGKVSKVISADRWYPIASLPGMNFVNRKQRREMEKKGPTDKESEDHFIKGPAVVVDYLAIYI